MNNTLIVYPQIRALLTSLEQVNGKISYASILPISNGTGLNISRSLNVRTIVFSFILIQSSPLYNLQFQDISFNSNNVLFPTSYMMWGLQSILISQ